MIHQFTEKISRGLVFHSPFPFSLCFGVCLSYARIALAISSVPSGICSLSVVPRISDVSRGIARGPATARRRLPSLPDLRAKWKLDVWARDAHEFIFLTSCWTFFFLFPAGEARGISSHVCAADLASLAYTVGSRDTFSWCIAHVSRRFSLSRSFSLFLALVLVASRLPNVCYVYEHTCERVSHLCAHTRTHACARVWYRWYSSRL